MENNQDLTSMDPESLKPVQNNEEQVDTSLSSDSSTETAESTESQKTNTVNSDEDQHEVHELTAEEEDLMQADLGDLSFEEKVNKLEELALGANLAEHRALINQLKSEISQQVEMDKKQQQAEYESGEHTEPFIFVPNSIEQRFFDALNNLQFRENREKEAADQERLGNLSQKEELLEQLRVIVSEEESQSSFNKLRDLQAKWKEVGPLPGNKALEINQSYKALLDQFYDRVKIHRELMELDFQRNLKVKTELCEKAEDLVIMENIREAMHQLNILHEQWKANGPVPKEQRNDIWQRFKLASDKIYEKRREFFGEIGEIKKQNYALKNELIEKLKEIDYSQAKSHAEWQKLSERVLAIQAEWKKIGFAPKALNEEVWNNFKNACDDFFNAKNVFYKQIRQDQNHNLNLKNELCAKAEELMHSENWKDTSNEFIRLQKEWKEIGAVPKKLSDKLWLRFRAACDTFFNRKNEFFAGKDQSQGENLKQKLALIDEIEAFQLSDDSRSDLDQLKEFQRRWMEIGFIPLKEKEATYQRYREAVNKHFDALKMNSSEKARVNYQNKISNLKGAKDGNSALRKEQGSLLTRINALKSDISLWENNIEFLSASKNAEVLRKEVEQKIEKAREELKNLDDKLKILKQS